MVKIFWTGTFTDILS